MRRRLPGSEETPGVGQRDGEELKELRAYKKLRKDKDAVADKHRRDSWESDKDCFG